MNKTEILNHLNTIGGTPAINEIAAKVAAMTGRLETMIISWGDDQTDVYTHKHQMYLVPETDADYDPDIDGEEAKTEAEALAAELKERKEDSDAATLVVTIKTANPLEPDKVVFMAAYEHETLPEWEEVDRETATKAMMKTMKEVK